MAVKMLRVWHIFICQTRMALYDDDRLTAFDPGQPG